MSTGRSHQIDKLGRFAPKPVTRESLETGEVGFVIAGIKEIDGAPVGDTITLEANPGQSSRWRDSSRCSRGYLPDCFRSSSDDYEQFRDALKKLKLNDSALHFEPEVSTALGFGFRCGFLGLLHMDIVQERLEREYDLDLITSAPTVIYEVLLTDGTVDQRRQSDQAAARRIASPSCASPSSPPTSWCRRITSGAVLTLCSEKRGVQKKMLFLGSQVSLQYELPLAEVVLDFFDRLKSSSRGYASFDYEFSHFQAAPLVKLDVLINGDPVDALSLIVHRDNSYNRGRELVDKMQELIPRQMFDIAVQAAIGSHIIARASVKAMRKNVLAKCYGGDITRKRKLLEKQKAGKKRMKQVGQVEIPQEAFLGRPASRQEGQLNLVRILLMLGVFRD